ncbi:MAG: twin-arginine translocase subunit TatC [Desulfobulbaceae bacterium]|nr:twin-arginine translocase subunit TatC [Desulfobulbaceae bacterium]
MNAALEHFAPHHKELRKRLVRIIISIVLAACLVYLFIDQIVAFFMMPLFSAYPALQKLVYTRLTEAFITYLKLSMLLGVVLSFPVVVYQAWMFVAPGLMDHERRLAKIIVFWSSFLFLGGVVFSFFIVLPRLLAFFMSYAGPNLQPLPRLGLYLTFVARMVLAFGIAFEIPFLMFMISRAGLVSAGYFRNKRFYYYIAIVVLAFLLTAGEPTATVLLSFPLFGLYEIGILLGRIFGRKKKPVEDAGSQNSKEG